MLRNSFHARFGRDCLAAAALIFLGSDEALTQIQNGPFTQAEVTAGHLSYHGYCSGCHGDDLRGGGSQGGGDAPPLTGGLFNQDWSKYTVRVLYQYVSKTMPDGLAGDLTAKTYRNIVSFLLAANGAKTGTERFDPDSNAKIGDITDGRIVTAVTNAPIEEKVGPR